MLKVRFAAALVIAIAAQPLAAAQLKPETNAAFDQYARSFEESMAAGSGGGRFLELECMSDARKKLAQAALVTCEQDTSGAKISGGQIHHWRGAMFLPNTTIDQLRAVMQDYARYKEIYAPEVTASRLLRREDDTFEVYLRLYKKQIITVVYNTTYRIHYAQPAPGHLNIRSVATRIAEVKDAAKPDTSERRPGDDNGFLWRLNTYWRFEEANGGLFAQCDALSLSRDVPPVFQSVVRYFTREFPRDSMLSTLKATRREIEARMRK